MRAIDPAKHAAWSQGDVACPNTKISTIAAAVASGVNMNEWVYESIECSGAGTELWMIQGGGHDPEFTDDFGALVVDFLLSHAKPS